MKEVCKKVSRKDVGWFRTRDLRLDRRFGTYKLRARVPNCSKSMLKILSLSDQGEDGAVSSKWAAVS